jgi:hypothetical protein
MFTMKCYNILLNILLLVIYMIHIYKYCKNVLDADCQTQSRLKLMIESVR